MSKATEERDARAMEQRLENVENALSKTELFFEEHQKGVMIGAIAILVIVALGWIINTQYLLPLKKEAQKEIFNAQYYFEADSFNLALNGDGINSGFLNIIDEYSSTPAGELAQYYAGVCYMHLGDFENAKKMLNAYNSDDEILSTMAICLCGDAEVELGNDDAALAKFKAAAETGNKLVAPTALLKLGLLCEKMGKADEAVAAYKKIKDDFPTSAFASTADKYMQSVKE